MTANDLPLPNDPYDSTFKSPAPRCFRDLFWLFSGLYYRTYHRLAVENYEKIPRKGPVLIISNHASDLDPPLVGTVFLPRLRFMAKSELFGVNSVFSWMLRSLGAYPVRRGQTDRESIRRTIRYLKSGHHVLIFPEGTRTPDGDLQELQAGVASIVMAVPNIPILPVRLRGTYEAMGIGKKWPRPVKFRMTIGDSFTISEMQGLPTEKKSLYRAVTEEMFTRLSAL